MSKYIDEWVKQYPKIKNVRKATKELIVDGKKLALEEYHSAKSIKKLKEIILNS